MTDKKYCRTSGMSVLGETSMVKWCIRKIVDDKVESPRIVKLDAGFERSTFMGLLGGCGPDARYWQEPRPRKGPWERDERLLP